MKIMGFTSIVIALFLMSFNCNIELSTSRKNVHGEPRNFIAIPTNSIDQRTCTCVMPTSCSCCETVKIFYTGDERRLCFNMVYQRNGLNFDLSMDSTIIKSMTVANYRPFRMCASVPGLLLTSICVNVLDLNQLSRSIVVCPRLEISTKIQRWHISYTCQNVSTDMPTGITPLNAAASTPMQVMMMPAGMMPVMGQAPGAMTMRPPAMGQAPGVMMMGSMMPAAMAAAPARPAAPGAAMPGAAPPAAAQQMMPIAGMMVMGMRPAGSTMMMVPATAAGTPSASATAAQRPPAATAAAATAQRPPSAPSPPSATPAMPPGGMMPPAGMMPPPGMIVPRPADGLVYSIQPLFRALNDSTAGVPDDILPAETINDDNSALVFVQADQLEQRSANENDNDSEIPDSGKAELTTQPDLHEKTTDDQVSNIEDATETITETEQADSSRILKRKKRQYDIFDIFQQSNRCDRAYRICITRSNNYIVSRVRGTRFNKNKNMDCDDKPTKIVHNTGDNLCSYLTSTIANDDGGVSVSFDSSTTSSQNDDTLDAIIVSDDSDDDSVFYSQNYPQTASITPYNRPRVFPLRTPPLIASQLKEQLKNFTNDTILISRM